MPFVLSIPFHPKLTRHAKNILLLPALRVEGPVARLFIINQQSVLKNIFGLLQCAAAPCDIPGDYRKACFVQRGENVLICLGHSHPTLSYHVSFFRKRSPQSGQFIGQFIGQSRKMMFSGNTYLPAVLLPSRPRSEEHTSELQSRENLVCRLLLEKK